MGSGLSPEAAAAAAFGEAVERYSYVFQGSESVVFCSRKDLEGQARTLSPATCNQFTADQYENRHRWNQGEYGFPYIPTPISADYPVAWSTVWSLTQAVPVFAPTQHCYFYSNPPGEPLVCVADSNGCAAGSTIEQAIEHALLELIERDAIALWWTARCSRPALALPETTDVQETERQFRAKGRRIWMLDLTSDVGIPVAAAIAASNGTPARFSLGFGAAFEMTKAITKALRELRQNEPIHEEPAAHLEPHSMQRAHARWLATADLDANPHFVPIGQSEAGIRPHPANLGELLSEFAGKGWNVCALDLTRPETNTPAVRILAPDLAIPYFRFANPRIVAALKAGFGPNPAPFAL